MEYYKKTPAERSQADYCREDVAHGIVVCLTSLRWSLLVVFHHLKAVGTPFEGEEGIGEVKVEDEDDHVEELAQHKHEEVHVVLLHDGDKVVDESPHHLVHSVFV